MPYSSDDEHPQAGQGRRRSVDVGGLALALGEEGSGQGWVGWDQCARRGPSYAELLSDMYTHTHIAISTEDHYSLDSWHFEPHKLPDEEVLFCALILFETLFRIEGLSEAVEVSINQVSDLLCNLRQVYRSQNSYHNFEHAVDVLQATHAMLRAAGRVPPVSILLERKRRMWKPDKTRSDNPLISCLNELDLFCLYVAAIGHDAGHPGLTNVFMKNAKTPLSSLYEQSALEQMHCTLLIHVLRRQGLGFLLDNPKNGTSFRKLLLETVLATDMRVHLDFMIRLERLVNGEQTDLWKQKVLICQAIIKCADISNPCRPLRVSQHWAAALTEEWSSQATLERYLQLPPTVQTSDGPLQEAKGQVFFIQQFAKPLFDRTTLAVPAMKPYATQCADNLKVWQHRVSSLSETPSSGPSDERSSSPSQFPEDFRDAFPMTLPPVFFRAEHDDRQSMDWHSAQGSSDTSLPSSSRSSSPSPVRATIPLCPVASAPASSTPGSLPPLSTASTSTAASTSTPSPHSPPISPSDLRSEYSDTPSRLSTLALSTVGSLNPNGTAAIRAAYKASVRKKTSFHRNSWNPTPTALPAFFDEPPMPIPRQERLPLPTVNAV
ncbi:hypothetical protein EVG20_g5611 [Dentipellis fragilis]|uniref:PDEase domain-containing protein n=1 Tax=Dentipellis fragilis TaxID=205917 RepID=A0A4Y9YT74_9AGAM|nr:hypothetical protein EVG20_g5611 [Dentipellis fragilis]